MKIKEIEIIGDHDYACFRMIEKISLETHSMFGLYLTDDFRVLHFYDVGNSTDDVEILEYSIPKKCESGHEFSCDSLLCPDNIFPSSCPYGACPKLLEIEEKTKKF